MQYETTFDIGTIPPSGLGGLVFGILFAAFFVAAGRGVFDRPSVQAVEAPEVPPDAGPPLPWHAELSAILALVLAFVAACGSAFAPKWRWGAAMGTVFLLVSAYQIVSGVLEVERLRRAPDIQILEGPVARIHAYLTRRRGWRETLELAGRRFEYGEDDPGSPYPLSKGSWPLAVTQKVRVAVVGDHILRVERQLCILYPRCVVSRFLWFRFEREVP